MTSPNSLTPSRSPIPDSGQFRILLYCCLLSIIWNLNSIEAASKVTRGPFLETLTLTGKLAAGKAEEFVVPISMSWQIQIKWMVAEGTLVKPGDTVARLDTSDVETSIEDLEKELVAIGETKITKQKEHLRQREDLKLEIQRAFIEMKKAEIDASTPAALLSEYEYQNRQLVLLEKTQLFEQAKMKETTELEKIDIDKKKLELDIVFKQKKLDELQQNLKALTLVSNSGGVVIYADHPWQDRKIQVGETVRATSVIATIPDLSSIQVEVWCNETDIQKVKEGQTFTAILDAYPDHTFSGKVKQIENNPEYKSRWSKSRYFRVICALDKQDVKIMKPGMSVRCSITVQQIPDCLLLPIGGIRYRDNLFWVKPVNRDEIPITSRGTNHHYMAIDDREDLHEGDELEE